MPTFVDPKTGEQYENNAPDADAKAQEFGLVTQEQWQKDQAEAAKPLTQKAGEAFGGALAGIASAGGVIGSVLPEALGGYTPEEEAQNRAFLQSPQVGYLRETSPAAFSVGQSVPAIAAGVALPGAGLAGLAATIGVDSASGYAQAAVDAELENREISGADVLRNAGLNLAFSLPLFGLGAYAQALLSGGKTALETAAETARATAGRRAVAAEGQELAQAVSDPAVRADLLDRVSQNAEEAVARSYESVSGLSSPPVARNPRAQREAIGALADVIRDQSPDIAARLDELTKGSARNRLKGLRALRDELASGGESDLQVLDVILGREDLWGSKALRGISDTDAVLGARPGAGASPEELIDYAGKLRKVRDGEFAGVADEIEQLAERQIEIRTAATIGDVVPEVTQDVVDYGAAMRQMDPAEAWRLTRDGADEGLRQLEATSVSDALQRVDDVLREDVAMAVKREDFIKGAESWTPEQVAKQQEWATERGVRALELAARLDQAEAAGYRIGGFRAEAKSLIERAAQRLTSADPVTANYEWDGLKRGLDSIAKRLAAAGPSIDEASKAWGSRAILELSDDLRKGLEDADLWGRNAGLQKETNAAWVKVIDPYSRITKQMAEFLGREFGVVGQAGIRRRFDPEMLNSVMSRGYQRNLRADIKASIEGLDQMMQARQSQGLSHLDRLAKARADLVRIQQGFDFADLLAVAKSKARAPVGLEIAGRLAGTQAPGGIVGSVVGPLAGRVGERLVGDLPMLAPGSKSPLAAVVRRHIGLTRGEQAAMLADPAFFERLPGSLQKQVMAGSAAGERAVELAQAAADAAKRDRELTARLMVNPEQAKRAAKLRRKKASPAVERARARASQGGMVDLGRSVTKPVKVSTAAENMGLSEGELRSLMNDVGVRSGKRDTVIMADLHAKPGVQEYLDRKAIERYTENSAFKVNRMLRDRGWSKSWAYSGASAPEKRYYEGLKGIARRAAEVMRRAPQQTAPLWRGTAVSGKQLDDWLRTGVVSDKAFQSFATDERVARRFVPSESYAGQFAEDGTRKVILRSQGGGGYHYGGPEAEVMFPPDTKMRVLGSSQEGDVTIIDVEPVPAQPAPVQGAVPRGGERGMVDLAEGIAKSPLGVGTAAAGAVVAYHHLGKSEPPDPESQTALQRFSDGYERPLDAFRAARKMVLGWQQDPNSLIDAIDGHMGAISDQSPKLAREMTAQAMRIASYLQDNLPGQRNVSVVYPDGTPPSRAEVRQFALRYQAAIDPAGVMADARAGRLERAQLETLQAVWPREYDALRAGVLEELGKGQATPRTRQRMSLLFNFPSGVDPALGPRTRAVVAAARAAQEERAPSPSSPAMTRQRLPSTAMMQPAGMAALSLGQQIGAP